MKQLYAITNDYKTLVGELNYVRNVINQKIILEYYNIYTIANRELDVALHRPAFILAAKTQCAILYKKYKENNP